MCRVPQLYVASLLYFSFLTAAPADRYGDWSVEQRSNSVLTLSFKQSAQVGNQLTTSELTIICEKREDSKFLGAILIPFDGTFENQHDTVPVLVQKNENQYDHSDLLQKWQNGTNDYIFSGSKEDVDELTTFITASEANGVRSIHFFFPNDPEDGPQMSLHLAISVAGFSQASSAFQKACSTH
jgi:hypothetical protein